MQAVRLLAPPLTAAIAAGGLWVSTTVTGYNHESRISRYGVNRTHCHCNCWDGLVKGAHSRLNGYGGEYRHVYFNYTPETVFLFIFVFTCLCLLQSSVVRVFEVVGNELSRIWFPSPPSRSRSLPRLQRNDDDESDNHTDSEQMRSLLSDSTELQHPPQPGDVDGSSASLPSSPPHQYLRPSAPWFTIIVFILSLYSQFYGAYSLFNYVNDTLWYMLRSQLFFSLTELLPSYTLYLLLGGAEHFALKPLTTTTARSSSRRVSSRSDGMLWLQAEVVTGGSSLTVFGWMLLCSFYVCLVHAYLAISGEGVLQGVLARLGLERRTVLTVDVRDVLLMSSDLGTATLTLHCLATHLTSRAFSSSSASSSSSFRSSRKDKSQLRQDGEEGVTVRTYLGRYVELLSRYRLQFTCGFVGSVLTLIAYRKFCAY